MDNNSLNLVLLGRTGAGKSASGNTILGRDAFKSVESFAAVTEDVAAESEAVGGFPVTVYDTPGISNSDPSKEDIQQVINANLLQKCKSCLCIFLLVMSPDRFTVKERNIVEKIETLLGADRLKNTWILFTRGDELEKENTSIKDFIEDSEPLTKLIHKYDQRYHVFSNKESGDNEQVKELLRKMLMPHIWDIMDLRVDTDELRIVLLGKTGVKIATGNKILGREAFKSVAKVSQRESSEVNGRRVTVIHTPELFDTDLSNEEIRREISHCISMMLPGPHVFLLLIPLGRFTKSREKSVKILQEMFWENSLKFTMLLFNRGNFIKNKKYYRCLGKPRSAIRNLTEACGNRVHVFNNNETGDRTQVYELLEKIDNMLRENGGSFYSCKMFREMERERQELQMKILMDRVRKEEEDMKILMDRVRVMREEEREKIRKLKRTAQRIIREKERTEREKQAKLEERLKEERGMREDQQKAFEEKLKLLEKQHEGERVEWRVKYETEKEKMMKKIYSETDDSLQVTAYRKLETEYSKWSWSLRKAMMETEIKLHNKIEKEEIHEVKETDLQKELNETSKVEKNLSEFFENDSDKYILIQWKTSFEVKIKELQENFLRETKIKLNEILKQRELKKKIDAKRKNVVNNLYDKSKEEALKLKGQINEETLKKEFDLFWEQSVKMIIGDTPVMRTINIMRDMQKILRDIYECVHVDSMRESSMYDILSVHNYSEYVSFKTRSVKQMFKSAQTLSTEDKAQIRSLVIDVAQQTDRMIQSFTISKMGYNISYIHKLIEYIKKRVTEHERRTEKYVFRDKFFIDLVHSVCNGANKTITEQHRLFRVVNDPALYAEKKREEYYSVFYKYYHGATSAVIFGTIICQKLKEPIEQSLLKKTARDLSDEIRSNCESLNGNRSKLEKHILKKLAEEENFDKYMDYIHNPRDHFKSFIRDEVSRYITDQFSVSVLPKMKKNIELLQQKILTAAHESTEHVQANSGDVDLWLKSFSQKLSEKLVFSEKDLGGVKHEDVDDFNLLEDVMRQELTAVMSDIRNRFSRNSFPVNLDHKFRPDELLIDLFCQCCWVQCPFCGASCTNTIENHDGDHSVAFHRVTGINGTCNSSTQDLCINICTTSVASDHSFSTADEMIPWREYRSAGGVYANWSITPDLSELPYWKWFACRFQEDLEKHYNKTFDGYCKILDEWKKCSKQDATESLDKYF